MNQTIKTVIYFDGKYFCARCIEVDVFTQGKTLDETLKNLKEAVSLHLENLPLKEFNLAPHPSLLVMIEEPLSHAA